MVRKITLAGLSLGAALQACDSSEEKLTAAHYAEHCSLDSECLGDLVCVFEHCHVECNDDEDCRERGGRCVRVPAEDAEKPTTVGVCQLPDEATCATTEECKGKQICAEDDKCHDPCSSKDPCFSFLSCSSTGECAEHSELDSNGDLIVGSAGAGNAGAGQTGGNDAGGSGGTHVGSGGKGGAATATGGTTPDPGGSGAGGEGGNSTGGNSTGGNSTGGSNNAGGNSTGGNTQSSGGTTTTGGNGSSAGNTAQGGGAGAGGDSGGAGGADSGGDVYVEGSDGVEAIENDDRDHTLPLPNQGSLWLPTGDQDWFYIDVPNDGRAHVIELLTHPAAGERAYVAAFAKADDSAIGGQVLLPEGTTRSVFVTVGSGTRTNISFTCDRPGRLDFELVGVTAENDVYEPNNDRYTAKTVALNTPIVGQQIVPYTSLGGIDVSDWFQVTLAVGPAAVNVVEVPANVGLAITMMDDTNASSVLKRWAPGVTGSTPVTITKAGVYRFQLSDHSNSGLSPFYSGVKPESLDRTYTVRFEQP